MALNLWKIGGGISNYQPLPPGINNSVNNIIGIGNYILRITAKSASSGSLRVKLNTPNVTVIIQPLTSLYVTYDIPVSSNFSDSFGFIDHYNNNDVYISDIQLFKKPLPKRTINGIDGFTSGKWTLHANATVVDDETLVLNATAGYQGNSLDIPVLPNASHVFYMDTVDGSGYSDASWLDSNKTVIGVAYSATSGTVKVMASPNNAKFLRIFLSSSTSGKFTFKRPMLNLGSIPAPYEKKRGERMVMPVPKKNIFDGSLEVGGINATSGVNQNDVSIRSFNYIPVQPNTAYTLSNDKNYTIIYHCYDAVKGWISYTNTGKLGAATFTTPSNCYFIRFKSSGANGEGDVNARYQLEQGVQTVYQPYAVQANLKPKKYVPKKNLFDGVEEGTIDVTTGLNVISTTKSRSRSYIPIKPNTSYTIQKKANNWFAVHTYGFDKSYKAKIIDESNSIKTFTTGADVFFIRVRFDDIVSVSETNEIMLTEGTTQTSYESYQLILPKAKTGLSFNGQTDYLQLPSMTMDSIEIECLIDSVQPNQTYWKWIFHTSSTQKFVALQSSTTLGKGTETVLENNVLIYNQRVKYKANFSSVYTGQVGIFGQISGVDKLKGILYKVTCYLAGNIVAQYDFENPSNIVGDKVIPNAKKLIPSFEDARWSLHTNSKVLGKDVLRLDATGTYQINTIYIPCEYGNSYYIDCLTNGYVQVEEWDLSTQSNIRYAKAWNNNTKNFTVTTANTKTLKISFFNGALGAGSFDFIKPQLYQLDGKEGSLLGSPQKFKKTSKRIPYRKR